MPFITLVSQKRETCSERSDPPEVLELEWQSECLVMAPVYDLNGTFPLFATVGPKQDLWASGGLGRALHRAWRWGPHGEVLLCQERISSKGVPES